LHSLPTRRYGSSENKKACGDQLNIQFVIICWSTRSPGTGVTTKRPVENQKYQILENPKYKRGIGKENKLEALNSERGFKRISLTSHIAHHDEL
jgi:hypothetical protein